MSFSFKIYKVEIKNKTMLFCFNLFQFVSLKSKSTKNVIIVEQTWIKNVSVFAVQFTYTLVFFVVNVY